MVEFAYVISVSYHLSMVLTYTFAAVVGTYDVVTQ